MKIAIVGGGPAGLYFSLLIKRAFPNYEVDLYERNRPEDTFGFGVVFSDATLGNLKAADPESHREIVANFAHWDDIETHFRGHTLRSGGHGFCGLSRKTLLMILQKRSRELGVNLHFSHEVADLAKLKVSDLLVAADGVGSTIRTLWADRFQPNVDVRPNRFVWLGTDVPFDAFTFYFKEAEAGLFRVHAYRYQDVGSTFIVECTDETFKRTGLAEESESDTIEYLQTVFAHELAGRKLTPNRSVWRRFPTVRNKKWHFDNVVLLGDAAHTAHFSIGSGTKLAMEDSIALCEELVSRNGSVEEALASYQEKRSPVVARTQRAAQVSLEWFEGTERYLDLPPLMFEFSLMTRSLRLGYARLGERDAEAAKRIGTFFGGKKPPWQAPLCAGPLAAENRVAGQGLLPNWADGADPGLMLSREAKPEDARCFWIRQGSAEGKPDAVVYEVEDASPETVFGFAEKHCDQEYPVGLRLRSDENAVVGLAKAAKRGGAKFLVVGANDRASQDAGRLRGAYVAERARLEAGILVVAEADYQSLDDINTVVLAGRADACLVGPKI